MKYRDRKGNQFEKTTKQDKFIAQAYDSAIGRGLMKFLSLPVFTKLSRTVLNSRLSSAAVLGFAEKNNIDLFDYEDRMYSSFNDFFTRKIKPGRRFITHDSSALISPCDGKVSAYEITNSSVFVVKNSLYSVDSLLRDQKLADKYNGGTALIIRLSVDDYHRYCYVSDGVKSRNRKISGMFYTVNPVINRHVPVYKENTREYCMIRTAEFGDIIQMEVGATLVGKITNAHGYGKRTVRRGEEKGYFEFGGSTIILLVEKDKVQICEDLIKNTKQGFETKVLQGEILGESNL